MRMIWFIALGSAVGGVARYAVSFAVQQRLGATFPVGTLLVNVSGALLMGFIMRYTLSGPGVSAEMRGLLTTGFCGGFTTMSTFSYETVALVETGDYRRAAAYVGATIILSLAAIYVGFAGARGLLTWGSNARLQG